MAMVLPDLPCPILCPSVLSLSLTMSLSLVAAQEGTVQLCPLPKGKLNVPKCPWDSRAVSTVTKRVYYGAARNPGHRDSPAPLACPSV